LVTPPKAAFHDSCQSNSGEMGSTVNEMGCHLGSAAKAVATSASAATHAWDGGPGLMTRVLAGDGEGADGKVCRGAME
jgi:hypothetical protein